MAILMKYNAPERDVDGIFARSVRYPLSIIPMKKVTRGSTRCTTGMRTSRKHNFSTVVTPGR
jgi:hypothetical protein